MLSAPVTDDLDPLHWIQLCGCHCGSLGIASYHAGKQNQPESVPQGGGRRTDTDKRNALLNYGYAVVRSAVARALVGAGLLPAFGVYHASVSNAFNLADDLVEPFRPFIDRLVWKMTDNGRDRAGETTVEQRRLLASAPTEDAHIGKEKVNLLVASERAAESLVRAMEANSAALLILPRLDA